MKHFKTKVHGVTIDSSALSAKDVQLLVQRELDKEKPGCFMIQVNDFDDTHINFRIQRVLSRPEDLNALHSPDSFLQIDKWLLFPDLSLFPDWNGYFVATCDCQNVLDEINEDCKSYRGSELAKLSIQSTPDYIDVYMSK